jgi:hypothetical protein
VKGIVGLVKDFVLIKSRIRNTGLKKWYLQLGQKGNKNTLVPQTNYIHKTHDAVRLRATGQDTKRQARAACKS